MKRKIEIEDLINRTGCKNSEVCNNTHDLINVFIKKERYSYCHYAPSSDDLSHDPNCMSCPYSDGCYSGRVKKLLVVDQIKAIESIERMICRMFNSCNDGCPFRDGHCNDYDGFRESGKDYALEALKKALKYCYEKKN